MGGDSGGNPLHLPLKSLRVRVLTIGVNLCGHNSIFIPPISYWIFSCDEDSEGVVLIRIVPATTVIKLRRELRD